MRLGFTHPTLAPSEDLTRATGENRSVFLPLWLSRASAPQPIPIGHDGLCHFEKKCFKFPMGVGPFSGEAAIFPK